MARTKDITAKSLARKKIYSAYMANQSAVDVANLLLPGRRVIGLTRGQFSLIDLIYATLQVTGKADVVVVTWSAGIKDVNTVRWMLTTDLIGSFMLVTDHSFVSRKNQYVVDILEFFGAKNIRTSEIHAKFVLIGNEDWKVCIRTSMNLNANRTCESFEIDDDPSVYDFYKNFVTEIAGEMPDGFTPDSSVVNRALDRAFETLKGQFDWQSNE